MCAPCMERNRKLALCASSQLLQLKNRLSSTRERAKQWQTKNSKLCYLEKVCALLLGCWYEGLVGVFCLRFIAGCVGKTSLCLRYVQNAFNDKHITTIQASYLVKRLNIDGRRVQLCIWVSNGTRETIHQSFSYFLIGHSRARKVSCFRAYILQRSTWYVLQWIFSFQFIIHVYLTTPT